MAVSIGFSVVSGVVSSVIDSLVTSDPVSLVSSLVTVESGFSSTVVSVGIPESVEVYPEPVSVESPSDGASGSIGVSGFSSVGISTYVFRGHSSQPSLQV